MVLRYLVLGFRSFEVGAVWLRYYVVLRLRSDSGMFLSYRPLGLIGMQALALVHLVDF